MCDDAREALDGLMVLTEAYEALNVLAQHISETLVILGKRVDVLDELIRIQQQLHARGDTPPMPPTLQ